MPSFAHRPRRTQYREDPAREPVRVRRPSRDEALDACAHAAPVGLADDPARGRPHRHPPTGLSAPYEEFFSGYEKDPVALLQRTFERPMGTTNRLA